jgi:hypothetical protein
MNQVLHIFRKDVHHFWKEMVLSWCVLAVCVWHAKQVWNPESMFEQGYFTQLVGQFFPLLLILSWWVLLIRAIQDERLVGDRQFWVTRPYHWPKLLASKILFALVLVNLPLLIAQLLILRFAGFAAFPYLGELLSMHLELITALLLPVAVIGAVTSTFVKVIIFGFVAVLYVFASSMLSGLVPQASVAHARAIPGEITGAIFLLACLAVLLVQYARRRTLASRVIIATAAALTLIVEVASPYDKLIARQYPSAQQSPLKVVLDTTKPEEVSKSLAEPPRKPPKRATIGLRLLASPTDNSQVIGIRGARVDIELPGVDHYRKKWQGQWGEAGIPNSPAGVSFQMPMELYDRVKSTPLKIDIEFALSVFQRGDEWQVIAQDGTFPVPRFGLCAITPRQRSYISCRAPLYGSGPLMASMSSAESTCPVSEKLKLTREITSYHWSLYEGSRRAAMIDPVVPEMINFNPAGLTREELQSQWRYVPSVCPGTPLHFTALSFIRHESTQVSLDGVKLSDYKLPDYQYGLGAVSGVGYTVLRAR